MKVHLINKIKKDCLSDKYLEFFCFFVTLKKFIQILIQKSIQEIGIREIDEGFVMKVKKTIKQCENEDIQS